VNNELRELILATNDRVLWSEGRRTAATNEDDFDAFAKLVRLDLGLELMTALGGLEFDKPSVLGHGPAAEFTVEGRSFWLEPAQNGMVRLVEGPSMAPWWKSSFTSLGGGTTLSTN
jgi:hypothetical protein